MRMELFKLQLNILGDTIAYSMFGEMRQKQVLNVRSSIIKEGMIQRQDQKKIVLMFLGKIQDFQLNKAYRRKDSNVEEHVNHE
jgi:hypothetical protein